MLQMDSLVSEVPCTKIPGPLMQPCNCEVTILVLIFFHGGLVQLVEYVNR